MTTREQFLEDLHKALSHLYEPDRLRQNPLATLLGVANRLDTFSALQDILIQAIESLEPDADEPPQSPAWEVYEPLFYRYVHQLNQEHVAKQLGMSVRHLRRKEHAAIEVLACHLWEQLGLGDQVRRQEKAARDSAGEFTEDGFPVVEELAWLARTPPDSPTDLGQTLADVVQLAEPLGAQHGIHIQVERTDDLPDLAVHEVALRQIFLILIGVAIHRTAGPVSISARPLPGMVEIQVSGAGTQATKEPALPVLSESEGSADGCHANARVRPKGCTDACAVPHNDAASLELAQQLTGLCRGRLVIAEHGRAFHATLSLPALEQVPVLVIDDNADALQLLRRYAVGTRYYLITTKDPQEALSLAEKSSPRLIVLDVMMPRMDGWKLLAHLRQHITTRHIPVVVCTILAQEELALSLGASSFVRKPVTRQAFLDALDQQASP